jgi:hypothetical protein
MKWREKAKVLYSLTYPYNKVKSPHISRQTTLKVPKIFQPQYSDNSQVIIRQLCELKVELYQIKFYYVDWRTDWLMFKQYVPLKNKDKRYLSSFLGEENI